MIDFARITVKAGDGGNGAGSFRGLKGKKYGKADGGDGGGGGNVYIECTGDVNTLEKYRFVKDYKALGGQGGLSRLRRGATGEDLVLKVPLGTQIKAEVEVFDLVDPGQRVLVARGGQGGRGNAHLKDEFGRRPRAGEKGDEGEFANLTLELKLIADVGLIGFPNAGKSTLISKLTAASPKVANYPFTTLEPNLGVLKTPDGKNFVIADIPGLIEGASTGKGLGDLFLRHIERTKVLVHLIDVSGEGANLPSGEDLEEGLWSHYQTIRQELKNYSVELGRKKEIVVISKADLVEKAEIDLAKEVFKKHRRKVFVISAVSGEGLEELVKNLVSLASSS